MGNCFGTRKEHGHGVHHPHGGPPGLQRKNLHDGPHHGHQGGHGGGGDHHGHGRGHGHGKH